MKRSMGSTYEETSGNSEGLVDYGQSAGCPCWWTRHPSGYVSADSSAFNCDFQMASLPPAVLTTSAPSGPETLHAS
jgi:hypothetical protein